ncbi:uncharacterized protein L969DRAFT_91431 [Mixia osmundae IAM 14324]|uniref:Small-subunit processome Utp12 domain-containing protein n=1 Tax=Mixia osmundae (strain CBS 9802 / IAM 14324 / JCM 22182 / KY 12970) TaxID=764103 RepID=G7E3V8_MIXOS|nr:uncharacterized protein L969DRAFT_91431 [Mixia osmundae IAM 14324]KEI41963.1 hypothetical protein L969DRAFT_91431 [Mixia osmundae IAM 14324]GAA97518.1 hypothetical protein E5Q_04196 [Mixia osmundae IAM 14324]
MSTGLVHVSSGISKQDKRCTREMLTTACSDCTLLPEAGWRDLSTSSHIVEHEPAVHVQPAVVTMRSYERHGPVEAFGVICSAGSNSVFDGKTAYVPALEDVLVWDVKKGELLGMWHEQGHRSPVSAIARSPRPRDTFAVGYEDGSVRLWSAKEKSVIVTFNGHRKAVTSLAFDRNGQTLASGSKDNEIILWDLVAEAGSYRLRGHRDQITGLAFVQIAPEESDAIASTSAAGPPAAKHLLSVSKDTFIKLWDLTTQHCISTTVAHRAETWALDVKLDPETGENIVLTGGGDGEAKAWLLDNDVLREGVQSDQDGVLKRALVPLNPSGTLISLSSSSHTQRIAQVSYHPSLPIIAFQTTERTVEIVRLRSDAEIKRKAARRRRREADKKSKVAGEEESEPVQQEWRDRLAPWSIVRASGKIRSFAFAPEHKRAKGTENISLMVALNSNALEIYALPQPPATGKSSTLVEPVKSFSLDLPGHRNDVRALAISSDDQLLASAAQGSLKVWNAKTTKCLRTLDCGYALCTAFLPGDRHIVVGCKSGELLLYDVASSSLLETVQAHTGALWSLQVRPDKRGLVTASADKDIKFWDFEIKEAAAAGDEAPNAARSLSLVHIKTLKMSDDVLSVRYSPDGRLLAVALLDMTVKVFYADTLKFFLSLYGHKLPVLAMDISFDSKLIVTCSADKNVKIWGLDFGDCHRSLFAHDESIMQVAFEAKSHYFWTVGKDKMVKYWDGDKFECIQKLEGHQSEVWALAVSPLGKYVATASHDKSIRIWEKLGEPLFLEEEREREMEAAYEANEQDQLDLRAKRTGEHDAGPEVDTVSKETKETLMAGERIMEAIDLADADRVHVTAWQAERARLDPANSKTLPPPGRNAIFTLPGAEKSAERHVLDTIKRIPMAALQDALLVLPFTHVTSLLSYIDVWARHRWNVALTSRVLFIILQTHHSQIVATRAMRSSMLSLRSSLREALVQQKGLIGYNAAALGYIRRQQETAKTQEFFESSVRKGGDLSEQAVREQIAASSKKRKRAITTT